jgi:hypothetical protein
MEKKKDIVEEEIQEETIVEEKKLPKPRLLNPNEIDCRVGTISEKGFSILLYKDARVDMAILDETFGAENWQRTHEVINDNLFCNIEVYFDGRWIKKQDVGTESQTEKEKGEASDSFKRAGFNWGIGRELYTAPFIWIRPKNDKEIYEGKNGKPATYTKIKVKEIAYNNNEISKLVLVDDKDEIRYTFGLSNEEGNDLVESMEITEGQVQTIVELLETKHKPVDTILKKYEVANLHDLTWKQGQDIIAKIEKL